MVEQYHIAILGAGPAGLSAAARAASRDQEQNSKNPSYVVLEGFDTFAKTIQMYQKGKHVMDEPGFLTLRAEIPFDAGKREQVLDAWGQGIRAGLNVRYNCEVCKITGSAGDFEISLADGTSVKAQRIVLAIGTQGNPRTLGVDGDSESDFVRYSLQDPREFMDETIVVVGAGDAAIENAIALSEQNSVIIVNRRAEFSRAKDGNLAGVLKAINDSRLAFECRYETTVSSLELPTQQAGGAIVLAGPDGEERIACDRILARLGTVPPRAFIESCGITIASPSANALPSVDRHYQSEIPGLYIIGALAGYPLIKQCMNQGYEVIEFIHGNNVRPADYQLLKDQFDGLPYAMDPEEVLTLYQSRVPMFKEMNALAFRELVIESRILFSSEQSSTADSAATAERCTVYIPPDHQLYKHGDYGASFFTLVEGEVKIQLEPDGDWHALTPGDFFGELALLSGQPRQGQAVVTKGSILIETPRRIMIKLMNSNESVRQGIERVFSRRALRSAFHPKMTDQQLDELIASISNCTFAAGDVIYKQDETGDHLHLLRSGSVSLSRGGTDFVVAQVYSGELLGQQALMGLPKRQETAIASVRTETMKIARDQFVELVSSHPEQVTSLQGNLAELLRETTAMTSQPEASRAVGFLAQAGLGEATNALVIDESLCVGCDNCERACAETHSGISRLNRKAGPSLSNIHIPHNCRHCKIPHCMKDCPPDAIRRASSGEVYITDSCIGCGNCVTNCPYDAIKLSYPAPSKPGLLSWLLFGVGTGPGEATELCAGEDAVKKAVKCDACKDMPGGPACERACPTGAARRISTHELITVAGRQ